MTVTAGPISEYDMDTFTRDVGTASGTQAITGLGFTPTHIYFIMAHGPTNAIGSWGMSDGTNENARHIGGLGWGLDTTDSIHVDQGSGNSYEGDVSSFDSDGFTINWTKTGATSGTITVLFFAVKEIA